MDGEGSAYTWGNGRFWQLGYDKGNEVSAPEQVRLALLQAISSPLANPVSWIQSHKQLAAGRGGPSTNLEAWRHAGLR